MRLCFFLLLILTLFVSCKEETVNTGGGLETETISNITGIIVDEDDKFVAGARVIADKADGDIILSSDTVLTDIDGLYKFTELDTGDFTFRAEKTVDDISYRATIGSHYNTKAAYHFGRDTLLATGYISGMVTTEDTKESYLGIELYIPGTSFSAHTDRYGHFTMSFIPLGTYQIVVDEDGYELDTSQTATISNPGDTAWLDSVVLTEKLGPDQFEVRGQFVTSKGLFPIQDLEVTIEKLDASSQVMATYKATTDSEGVFLTRKGSLGTFRFSILDTIDNIIFSHSFYKIFEQAYDYTIDPIALVPKTGHIAGSLTKENSNYPSGVKVKLLQSSTAVDSTTTNGGGYYSFEYIKPGDYTLHYQTSKYDIVTKDTTITNDVDTTYIAPFVLPLSDTVFTLIAKYQYPDETTAFGAEVYLHEYGYGDKPEKTTKRIIESDGEAEFRGLKEGRFSLTAFIEKDDLLYRDSGAIFVVDTVVPLSLPPQTLTYVDSKTATIVGSVSKEESTINGLISVKLDHTKISAITDDKGNFMLVDVPLGSYELKCSYDGYIVSDAQKIELTKSYDTITIPHIELKKATSYNIPMVYINEGLFHDDHNNLVSVDSFHMGETEVTLGQYKKFDPNWVNLSGTQDNYEPVAGVSFSQAIQFCNWLSIQEGFDSCYTLDPTKKATRTYGDSLYWILNPDANGYRLPTGDEWEQAANGKDNDPIYNDFGTDDGTLKIGSNKSNSNAWIPPVSENTIHPVLGFRSNPNKLYDMTGNVWEYTWERSTSHNLGSRGNYYEDSEYLNESDIYARGASAIWPDVSKMLSEDEMRVQVNQLADSERNPYFADEARGFRLLRRY